MYELRQVNEGSYASTEMYGSLEEAMAELNKLGKYAGCKAAWFSEANCGNRIPDDFEVSIVEVEVDEDGDFVCDIRDIETRKYGYDEMLAEYGSEDAAPFGMRRSEMMKMGW